MDSFSGGKPNAPSPGQATPKPAAAAAPSHAPEASSVADGRSWTGFTPGAGRLEAAGYLATFPPGTVGHVAHGPVKKFGDVLGNFGSGNILHHYQDPDVTAMLHKPATKENIAEVADRETKHWRSQQGIPYAMGLALSSSGRASVLNCEARRLGYPVD
jgi:hypothetical protein